MGIHHSYYYYRTLLIDESSGVLASWMCIHVHIQACDLKLMLTIMKKTGESVCVGGEGKCALFFKKWRCKCPPGPRPALAPTPMDY